ncbi:MAG: hypothetical protein HDR00_15800 [Lachnospiraceae bacterium]|nr:hypothetical protein [Lachnospiraceae bacterium]
MKEKNNTDTNINSRIVVWGKTVSDKAASKDKHTVNNRVGKTSFFF